MRQKIAHIAAKLVTSFDFAGVLSDIDLNQFSALSYNKHLVATDNQAIVGAKSPILDAPPYGKLIVEVQ